MKKIAIVTDSTADLPPELVAQYGITVVPLKVIFNGKEVFYDGVDLLPEQFYSLMAEKEQIPTTSQPSPAEFAAVYQQLLPEADIISIHMSSHMSGTVQSAKLASQMFPEHKIFVIDSKSGSMGMGLIVLEAARAVAAGKSLEEVLNVIHTAITKCKVFFFVDSLKYLHQGGRIGKASALLGTMLSIKPILHINEGIIAPYEKIRGRARALERLAQIFLEKTAGKRVNYCLIHGNDPQGLETLLNSIMPTLPFNPPIISRVGPVVGAHVGPGAVGVTFIEY